MRKPTGDFKHWQEINPDGSVKAIVGDRTGQAMTTSPNSSAEAFRAEWRKLDEGEWACDGDTFCAFADSQGAWDVYRKTEMADGGQSVRRVAYGAADGLVSAMEAADLAIAEMERKE